MKIGRASSLYGSSIGPPQFEKDEKPVRSGPAFLCFSTM